MKDTADALSSVAGATGVGTLCLLALFLFLDGRAPSLFPTFEEYAKTATWGIVAALPVLAIAFVVGLTFMNVGTAVVRSVVGPNLSEEIADAVRLETFDVAKSILAQTYVQLRQERNVLSGAAFALVLLAVGALSEISNLSGLRGVITTASGVAVIGGVLLFWSAAEKGRQAHRFSLASIPTVTHSQSQASHQTIR